MIFQIYNTDSTTTSTKVGLENHTLLNSMDTYVVTLALEVIRFLLAIATYFSLEIR